MRTGPNNPRNILELAASPAVPDRISVVKLEQPTFLVPGSVELLGLCHTIDCQAGADPFLDPDQWPISEDEKAGYLIAMERERGRWQGHDKVREALESLDQLLLEGATSLTVLGAAERALNAIAVYESKVPGKFGMVPIRAGLDELQFIDGVCRGRAIEVPMLRYLEFAKAGEQDLERLRFSMVTGVCAAALSSPDPSNPLGLLLLQLRSPEFNYPYGGVAGAGIAGYLSVAREKGGRSDLERYLRELDGEREGILDITNDLVFGHIGREGREEMGLPANTIDRVNSRILGVVKDLAAPHFEIGVEVRLPFEFARHARMGAHHSLRLLRERQHPHDFGEHFVGIPPTPRNVLTLAQKGPPMPPTHLATYVIWAYTRTAEFAGEKAARGFLKDAEEGALSNFENFRQSVEKFYQDTPEKYLQVGKHDRSKLTQFRAQQMTESRGVEVDFISKMAEIPDGHHIKDVWEWLLQAKQRGVVKESELQGHAEIAWAMWNKVVHSPNPYGGYDPRRIPEEQGLLPQREAIECLVDEFNQGNQGRFDWGTVELMKEEAVKLA